MTPTPASDNVHVGHLLPQRPRKPPVDLVVNIVGTGLATLWGGDVGGLMGSEIGAVVPVLLQQLAIKRRSNVVTVTKEACRLANLDGAEFVEWVKADESHAAFLIATLEAAWEALDDHKLRNLAHALAHGLTDSATLDVDRLVVASLRRLDAPHVRLLSVIDESYRADDASLARRLPDLADGIAPLIATLEATGCVLRVQRQERGAGSAVGGTYMPELNRVTRLESTPFGKRLLSTIPRGGGITP